MLIISGHYQVHSTGRSRYRHFIHVCINEGHLIVAELQPTKIGEL